MSGRDGFAGGIGRLTPGNIISDSEGNLTNAITGEPVASPGAPAAKEGGRPQFSKEELDLIKGDAAGEIDAELDAEDARRAANLKRLGLSDDEIERHGGKSAAKAPAVSQASAEQRLADLRALKTTDARRYWSDEVQAEELRLIEQIEQGKSARTEKAEAKTDDTEASEPDGEDGSDPAGLTPAQQRLSELREELDQIAEKRKADRRAYDRDETLQARERELLAEIETTELGLYVGEDIASQVRDAWGSQGGVEANLGAVAGLMKSLQASGIDEAFGSDFDALPAAVRVAVMSQFGVPGGSLSGKRAAVEKSLSGADLAAVQQFWGKWGEAVTKGLVR